MAIKYYVKLESVELHNISVEDVEKLRSDVRFADFKWNGELDGRGMCDPTESYFIERDFEGAMKYYYDFITLNISTWYPSNKIVVLKKASIEEIEVDEDDEFVCSTERFYAEKYLPIY